MCLIDQLTIQATTEDELMLVGKKGERGLLLTDCGSFCDVRRLLGYLAAQKVSGSTPTAGGCVHQQSMCFFPAQVSLDQIIKRGPEI